ncbi:hypothetical protein [Kordiimonas aestuarii]|uniref:hypothetical protein n=1 Tax=Kordiimonas aestuarii TaxID=1005925 RepID=UPI0021CF81AA|nr:hypothetical protein [Kordiimonas aestuarii]
MRTLFIVLLVLSGFSAVAGEPIKELAALSPFAGKTWRTASGSVDGSENATDISKWEWAMHGRAVRITHSVNGGSYAGESLIHWDGQQEKIIFRYVTTASFYTDGIITPVEGGIEVHEFVRGAKSGPTETRSAYMLKDGEMHGWAQLKTDGEWGEISEFRYEEAPDAVPVID